MRIQNQIFMQLREANRYACAQNPYMRRLAVLLLDNIVELQLWRKADLAFIFDTTTSYSGVRKHNYKLRRTVSRNHAELLAFAQKQTWISDEDVHLLRYAHRIRNAFYHEGMWDAADAELAIRLLFHFVKKHFPSWRHARGMIELSPNQPIPIELADTDITGFRPLVVGTEKQPKQQEYGTHEAKQRDDWRDAIDSILTYRPTEAIQALIQRKIEQSLDQVEKRIKFINENEGVDFTDVAAHRFAIFTPTFEKLSMERKRMSASGTLNLYLAMLDNEEKLLDTEDLTQRARAFHKLLDDHSFVKDPFSAVTIEAWRTKAETIMRLTEGRGIALFLNMDQDLDKIRRALGEMASDLDGHIQLMIDVARGK